ALGDRGADELVGLFDVVERLPEIDDVDPVALGEDEALHLRVPAAGLVSEVDTALQQLAHGHDGHVWRLLALALVVAAGRVDRRPGAWSSAARHPTSSTKM